MKIGESMSMAVTAVANDHDPILRVAIGINVMLARMDVMFAIVLCLHKLTIWEMLNEGICMRHAPDWKMK